MNLHEHFLHVPLNLFDGHTFYYKCHKQTAFRQSKNLLNLEINILLITFSLSLHAILCD